MMVAICLAAGLGAPLRLPADTAQEAPDFKEVCDLIRAHVPGLSNPDLNRAAVAALVSALSPKVLLITNGPPTHSAEGLVGLSRTMLFEGDIGYFRVQEISGDLAKTLRESFDKLSTTNKLKGVVLDLRFAQGTDYPAALAVADLFSRKERPLLNWGTGMVSSKENDEAIRLPVAVLVNRQTAGAPEALAGMFRLLGAGLVLGSRTAGQALVAEEFPLKNGDRLRIGTAPMTLGDGSALSTAGLKPDIVVEVSSQDERVYYADAFRLIPKTTATAPGNNALLRGAQGTNRTVRRPRFNEAELVRERRDGYSPENEVSGAEDNEPDKPMVHDPALARALDLLKGLAVVRQAHS